MTGSTVAVQVGLDAVLRAGARRTLAERPSDTAFDLHFGSDVVVTMGQAARIVAVLREAILNSIDYAHPAGVPGRIEVCSALERDGTMMIQIADDGVGLPEGFDTLLDGGEGFHIMRRAGAELGAVLSFKSSCLGLAVGLLLPTPVRGQSS